MIIVKGEARLGEGELERLRAPLNAWIAEVRQREGCLSFAYASDLADPNLIHVIQAWRDDASLEAHLAELGPLMHALAGAEIPLLKVDAYKARFIKTLMGE